MQRLHFTALSLMLLAGCASPATTTVTRGDEPPQQAALDAAHRHLKRALNDYDSMKDFALVSGPSPVRATNFAGNYEEVWLLCVEYNAKNLYGAYVGIRETPIALRYNSTKELEVISSTNWMNYKDKCQ